MQQRIQSFLVRVSTEMLIDSKLIEQQFEYYLKQQDPFIISLINRQFMIGQNNLIDLLKKCVDGNKKLNDDVRKVIYTFFANYITCKKNTLIQYISIFFKTFKYLFRHEKPAKVQLHCLQPILKIIQTYDQQIIHRQSLFNPTQLHEQFLNLLKINTKISASVKGCCWNLLGLIQNKFSREISGQTKRSVQQVCLMDLKGYCDQQKNFSACAWILKSFCWSLRQNYLSDNKLFELFKYLVNLIPPIRKTYEVSLASIQLLNTHSSIFHNYIMANAGSATDLLDMLGENMNHHNRQFKFAVLNAMNYVTNEYIRGIETDRKRYQNIYYRVLPKMWDLLKMETLPIAGADRKYTGGIITIIRILGSFSPLILAIQGIDQLNKFFQNLLSRCTHKITQAFADNPYDIFTGKNSSYMKIILYNQKQLTSFLGSLGKIIRQLNQIEQKDALLLSDLFMTAVKQYPLFLEKYVGDLLEAMVNFLMGIHSKQNLSLRWTKRVISEGLKQSLDSIKFNISQDQQYYRMISKATSLYRTLLTHSSWLNLSLIHFATVFFDNIEHLILNLDISYRSNLELQISDEEVPMNQEDQNLKQLFFMINEDIHLNNINDFQFMCSLALLYDQTVRQIDQGIYAPRLYEFYSSVLYKIRIYPRCIPLMKIVRSLNLFIIRNNWFKWVQDQSSTNAEEIIIKLHSFYNQVAHSIFKFQEQYFYQALKMLLSMPYQIYFFNNNQILRRNLSPILKKSLEIGQEIVSVASAALNCISNIFDKKRGLSERYLMDIIPYLQKFVGWESQYSKEQNKSYLFLRERKITRSTVAGDVMRFLGSIGGLCHLLVDNQTKDYIAWDYHCRVDLTINIVSKNYNINLTRLLSRICFLAMNGKQQIKVAACETLHAIILLGVGRAANRMTQSRENLAAFLEKVLETVIGVAANTSHPCQQLLHTLLMQLIHYLAKTYEQNSADVQTILKHLLVLYSGSEDMSILASNCLAELMKWHVRQSPSQSHYPLIKIIVRDIKNLLNNKKARDGLIELLIKFLKLIRNEETLMNMYALQLVIIFLGLTKNSKSLQPALEYLVKRYIVDIGPYIKTLIINHPLRNHSRWTTLKQVLQMIYDTTLFSKYSQQRQISFIIWQGILNMYSLILNQNPTSFLKNKANPSRKFLFPNNYEIEFNIQQIDLAFNCYKITSYAEVWVKLSKTGIFQTNKINKFHDFEIIYLQSFTNFITYAIKTLNQMNETQRLLNEKCQQAYISCIISFVRLIIHLQQGNGLGNTIQLVSYKLNLLGIQQIQFTNFLLLLAVHPNKLISNFNFDIINTLYTDYYISIMGFLKLYLPHNIFEFLIKLIQAQFHCKSDKLMEFLLVQSKLYERQVKAILKCLVQINQENSKQNYFLHQSIQIILHYNLSINKIRIALWFIFQHPYVQLTQNFVCNCIRINSPLYIYHQKIWLKYLSLNWITVGIKILDFCYQNSEIIKMLMLLIRMMKHDNLINLLNDVQNYLRNNKQNINLQDCLRIHFIVIEAKKIPLSIQYLLYLEQILVLGFNYRQNSLSIHNSTMNLAGLLLKYIVGNTQPQYLRLKSTISHNIRDLNNLYLPLVLSKLRKSQDKTIAINYLQSLKDMILLSNEYSLIELFFITLKDTQSGLIYDRIQQLINNLISDLHSKLTNHQQKMFLQWLLTFYWAEDLDKDPWCNFRLLVIERIFIPALKYANQACVIQLFQKYIKPLLEVIINQIQVQDPSKYVLQLQLKKGAFIILEQLYLNLPNPKSSEGQQVHKDKLHQKVISYCTNALKNQFPKSQYSLLQQYDSNSSQSSLEILRQYYCFAYNCLLTVFVCTQSNPQHYRNYLFEDQRGYLWNNICSERTNFGLEIKTDFKMMQPPRKVKQQSTDLNHAIKKHYFCSSLYVIEQQNVPTSQIQIEKDKGEDEVKEEIKLELDVINSHECMLALLRVIDHLHSHFYDGSVSGWMSTLYKILHRDNIRLETRLLLTKLLLNRPAIFTHPMWADCFLKYLVIQQNGGKFIHYYYRDILKQFMTYLTQGYNSQNKGRDISKVLMRIIKTLPHEDIFIYTDNIDILDALLKCQDVTLEQNTILKMLKTKSSESGNAQFQWRMCAIIVLKLALEKGVPVTNTYDEFLSLKNNNPNKLLDFYSQLYIGASQPIKYIFELLTQSAKKYRISAAGFIGSLMNFIFSNLIVPVQHKDQLLKLVYTTLDNLVKNDSNRTSKERFSLVIYNIVLRFPQILDNSVVFERVSDGLVQYSKEERRQIILTLTQYTLYFHTHKIWMKSNIPNIIMTLRKHYQKILNDSAEVQQSFIVLLLECSKHHILQNPQILRTYLLIYDRLQEAYIPSTDENVVKTYFQVVISLKNYVKDLENRTLQNQQQFGALQTKIKSTIIKGLGNTFQSVRTLIFQLFESEAKQGGQIGDRLIEIFGSVYNKQLEAVWIKTVVPLMFSLVKQSSDYSRILFEKGLVDLMQVYDFDFRQGHKADSSQPYTPIFTIGLNPTKQNQSQLMGSIGGQRLRGVLKATQNYGSSQQDHLFSIMASQPDSSSIMSSQNQQSSDKNHQKNHQKINSIFRNQRRRNKFIQQFQKVRPSYASAINVINNKIRFKKSFDSQQMQQSKHQLPHTDNISSKSTMLRNYKVGELPNIEIALSDIMDPLIWLSGADGELAGDMFILLFQQVCQRSWADKDRLQKAVCQLLSQSVQNQFNFTSTLQKCLICLCQNGKQQINFSMRDIAFKSNIIDNSIIFTQQNLNSALRTRGSISSNIGVDYEQRQKRVYNYWGDLVDLYHHINEDDLNYALILKIACRQQVTSLQKALQLKKKGQIKLSKDQFQQLWINSSNQRLKNYIESQKIDCLALLSQWDQVEVEITTRKQNLSLSNGEKKILTIALQNKASNNKSDLLSKLKFDDTKFQYEKAITSLVGYRDSDSANYSSKLILDDFINQWKKTSSFAFNARHDLLQVIQKTHQLRQFLEMYRQYELKEQSCINMMKQWNMRLPSHIYDTNLTWMQILEGRNTFVSLLRQKIQIPSHVIATYHTKWLLQVIDGMLSKGVLGFAQILTKKALHKHKQSKQFCWEFYESIARLKLFQLMHNHTLKIRDYEIVPTLIRKQMINNNQNDIVSQMKVQLIENEYLEGYLQACRNSDNSFDVGEFVIKVGQVYTNYDQLKRQFNSKAFKESSQKPANFLRQIHFKFAVFLENMLSVMKGKFEIKEINQAMNKSNLSSDRLAHVFVSELITSIELVHLEESDNSSEQEKVFGLILKLLKVVQNEYQRIGQYFAEAITDDKLPIWIFLYFIPQIIKTLNSFQLAPYFQDLFYRILNQYPEALIYPFNCCYPQRKDCLTQQCLNIYDQLHRKLTTNFAFIQNLHLLHHPELRLKEILLKFTIPGEAISAVEDLQNFIKIPQCAGRYNKKFLEDWNKKVIAIINLKKANNVKQFRLQVDNALKHIEIALDPNKEDQVRKFTKMTDASIFFENYNAAQYQTIEVPATSYRTFQQPFAWNKVYIESFDHTLLTLKSLRRPKKFMLYGSNEKRYMFLLKGGEDVRLDQRIEEIFDLINRILRNDCQCSRKQLQIKRFQVIPLKKMLGVFEWVQPSQTLRTFLEVEQKDLNGLKQVNLSQKNGGFETYYRYLRTLVPNSTDKTVLHKALQTRPEEQVIRKIRQCQSKIDYGLLRRAMLRLSRNFDAFLHIKNSFIKNYAACCLVTYVLGIGDRHLDNFLINAGSASIVMIDFGCSFGAGIDLSIPEIIPFRLTKVFRQLLDPIGFQGIFKKSMVCSYEALSKKMSLLVDYCDVFIDDPLIEWVWGSRRQLSSVQNPIQLDSTPSGFSMTQQQPQKKIFSKKIKFVQNKLLWYNPRSLLEQALTDSRHKSHIYFDIMKKTIWRKHGKKDKILTTQCLIDELISLATDQNILGRSYIGLSTYI